MYIAGHAYTSECATQDSNLNLANLMAADSLQSHSYNAITDRNFTEINRNKYYYLHLLSDYQIHFGSDYVETKKGWVYRNMRHSQGFYYDILSKFDGRLKKDSKRGICHTLVEYCIDIFIEESFKLSYAEIKERFLSSEIDCPNLVKMLDSKGDLRDYDYYSERISRASTVSELVAEAAANKFVANYDQSDVEYFQCGLASIFELLSQEDIENELNRNIEFIKENLSWNSLDTIL